MNFKRSPFGLQKDYIWKAKGVLLEGKRGTFGGQKESFWKTTVFTSETDGATSSLLTACFFSALIFSLVYFSAYTQLNRAYIVSNFAAEKKPKNQTYAKGKIINSSCGFLREHL